MEICFLRFDLPSSWAGEKGHRKCIFSKTLSRVEIFENAVLPQSWGWVKHEEVFENDYVTGSDTSKCPCPNKRWYRFQSHQSLLCFCVNGRKRSKNAACGRRFFWKRDAGEITYPDIFENEDFASVLALRPHNAIVIIPFYSNQSNVVLVDAYFLENGEKTLGFQKYPDTCGHRASERIYVAVIHATQ